jgi:uncharacterized repeat protein (TIGR01451 family)
MGNGPWLGRKPEGSAGTRSAGKGLDKSSGRSPVWPRALAALVVLLLAGSALLGGFHRSAGRTSAQLAAASVPTLSGSSLVSDGLRSNPLRSNPLHSKLDARAVLGQLPLIFEANQGQADSRVKFLARGAGYDLSLDATGAVLAMQTEHSRAGQTERFVRMKLAGANAAAVAGTDPLPGKSNYIMGNDPRQWRTGIPQFRGVRYQSVYPGIDLVFYGNQGRLEYDFRVAPGGDPARAELQFEGAAKLEVSGGDLILTGQDEGGLRLRAPHIYQRVGDRQELVAGRFVLRSANRVGFEVGEYDRGRELIIDPVLDFSTYFGGSGTETSPSIAVNGNGNIYIVGTTTSPQASFPPATSTTSIPPTLAITPAGPSHIFVAEINPSQPPSVVYETFIGGNGADSSVGISLDSEGNAYLAGNTSSTNFPTFGIPYQTAPETKTQCGGSPTCTSVFVSVLNALGSALTYSSYLSGDGNDTASGMAIDLNQDIYITGTTTSNDTASFTDVFPATLSPLPYQSTPHGSPQFFVTKVDINIPGPGSIAYSTYFGGSSTATCGTPPCNVGGGVAVDSIGNIYFDGTTNFFNSGLGAYGDSGQTEDFPILNAYQPCLDTPPPTVLTNPNTCTAPGTTSYPTDAFVAKINPNAGQTGGPQLLFSTYLGGGGDDTGTAIAIDSTASSIYLTGSTDSTNFVLPTNSLAFDTCLNNSNIPPSTAACTTANTTSTDAYVARMLNPTLSTSGTPNDVGLTYFSYLGGMGNDSGLAIAVLDASNTSLGDALVTGATSSTNFPVSLFPIQSTLNGTQNAFFAQIDTTTTAGQNGVGSYVTYFGGNGVDRGTGIAVDPNLNSYLVGDTTSTLNLRTFNPVQSTLAPGATRNAFVVKLGTATDLCITCVAPIISQVGTVGAGNQLTVTFTVANEGPDPSNNVSVIGSVSPGATLVSGSVGTGGTCSAANNNSVVCQIPTMQSGSSSSVVFFVTPNSVGLYSLMATVSSANNTNTDDTATASFTAAGYSVFISPSAQTVAAGQIASYGLQVNPTAVFPANVNFMCSALPSGAACNFTNSSVNLGNGPQATTLNITTTAQPVSAASAGWHRSLYALWLLVPGMAMLVVRVGGGTGKKSLLGLLMLSVFFALVLLQPSCSTGKTPVPVSGTPSGIYPLTVTVSSGSFSKSVPFQLTVTP